SVGRTAVVSVSIVMMRHAVWVEEEAALLGAGRLYVGVHHHSVQSPTKALFCRAVVVNYSRWRNGNGRLRRTNRNAFGSSTWFLCPIRRCAIGLFLEKVDLLGIGKEASYGRSLFRGRQHLQRSTDDTGPVAHAVEPEG